MLPVSNTKNQGQRGIGGVQTSFTCSKLDTHKRSPLYGMLQTLAIVLRGSLPHVIVSCEEMFHNVAEQFVTGGGKSPGASHGKQSHFFEFGFDLMSSNVLLFISTTYLISQLKVSLATRIFYF